MHPSTLAKALVDLSFLGGCILSPLTFAPLLWPRKKILVVCLLSAIGGFLIATGRIRLGEILWPHDFYQHWFLVGAQMTLFIAAGFSLLVLAAADTWKHRDAGSLLLMLWVFGTFIFTGFVNWIINARSLLPLVPAAGILLARRVDELQTTSTRWRPIALALPFAIAGAISLWLTWADTKLANSARTAATVIAQKTRDQPGTVWFTGHWGFQYYMELLGAHPVVVNDPPHRPGDYLAVAGDRAFFELRPRFITSSDVIQVPVNLGITTTESNLGAGFYSSDLGPLPFAFGPVPPERYTLLRLGTKSTANGSGASP